MRPFKEQLKNTGESLPCWTVMHIQALDQDCYKLLTGTVLDRNGAHSVTMLPNVI